MGCQKCEGQLISLLYYRDWAARNICTEDTPSSEKNSIVEQDTKTAVTCVKCSKLMTKHSISGKHSNHMDFCAHCDEVWLDGHEWALLKSLNLSHNLPKVLTNNWQKMVRDEKTELRKIERLGSQINEIDLNKAVETKKWLKTHNQKNTILQFIGSD